MPHQDAWHLYERREYKLKCGKSRGTTQRLLAHRIRYTETNDETFPSILKVHEAKTIC